MEDIAEILKQIRIKSKKNQADFAKEIGVAQTTWSAYEAGKTRPKMVTLLALERMGYTIPGLTTGIVGDMKQERLIAENETPGVAKAISEARMKQIRRYPPDTPIDQIPPLPQTISNKDFIIPLMDQKLSAGKGFLLPENDSPTGYIAAPPSLSRYGKNLAALYVDGDSMEPTLHRGDMIVCDSCGWDGEGIYAIQMDGTGFVKRLSRKPGKVVVISDNPAYETWEEPSESDAIRIVGRVHCVIRNVD